MTQPRRRIHYDELSDAEALYAFLFVAEWKKNQITEEWLYVYPANGHDESDGMGVFIRVQPSETAHMQGIMPPGAILSRHWGKKFMELRKAFQKGGGDFNAFLLDHDELLEKRYGTNRGQDAAVSNLINMN